jgi:hypothetical protein
MKKYQFKINDKLMGPFSLDFIEALFLCNKVSSDTLIQSIDDNSFKKLKELRKIKPLNTQNRDVKVKSKDFLWIFFGVISLIMCGISLLILDANNVLDGFNSGQSSSKSRKSHSSYNSSSYTPSSSSSYQRSTYTAPSSYSSSGNQYSSGSGSHRTSYSVSSSNHAKLESMKASINLAKTQVKSLEDKMNDMDNEIASMKSTLDRSSQVSIDIYNGKIGKRNEVYNQYKSQIQDLNTSVDVYNNYLHQVGK